MSENLFIGTAIGGPIDGEEVISRYPEGLLLVDAEAQRCWVYKRTGSTFFLERDDDGSDERALNDRKLEKTGIEEFDYDVIAYADPAELAEDAANVN